MLIAHRTVLIVAVSILVGCGASHTATLELELSLDRPAAGGAEVTARIERRLRTVGGEALREVDVKGLPDDRYRVSVALALPERCEGLAEVRASFVDVLTRSGRLGFHRTAGEPGERQLDLLAAELPEGSLRRDAFTPLARTSSRSPEELQRAIAALPPVVGVRLALEDQEPDPTPGAAARGRQIWALEEPAALDDSRIAEARVETYEPTGQPVVVVDFDERGKSLFGELSASLVNDFLVIVLDGKVVSAPKVMEPIRGGRAMLQFGSGTYTSLFTEARIVAAALSTRALAERVVLERVAETCHQ